MSSFIWVHVPTSGTTVYVDHRGNDETGDGSAQNPYKTILKATTVAPIGSNIVLGDGEWTGSRYSASTKYFNFYGNSRTFLTDFIISKFFTESYSFIILNQCILLATNRDHHCPSLYNCIAYKLQKGSGNYNVGVKAYNSILINSDLRVSGWGDTDGYIVNCITYKFIQYCNIYDIKNTSINSIDLGGSNSPAKFGKYGYWFFSPFSIFSNFTIGNILGTGNINNTTTEQTIVDYFNYIHPNVLSNPNGATLDDWLACDFTAKNGSANIGASSNGGNIGLNEGFTAYADNSANDIFNVGNGAVLRNIVWNSTLKGYVLQHKDKICAGSTVNTITLASDAEATDDYYNGLFVGITSGSGLNEIHKIVDYDGTTKVCTIEGSWAETPNTESIYSITGTIDSAVKDFGRSIKVKQNWAFCKNMTAYTDSTSVSYGRWKEYITSPIQIDGVWQLRECSNFGYEYSIDGINWYSNTELLAGTNTDCKEVDRMYGNASESFVASNSKPLRLRFVKFHIHIGFNIG